MLCDMHTHSKYSYDGAPDASPDAMCERAIELGLTDYAITDHIDVNFMVEGWYTPYRHEAAWNALTLAKEKYRDRLNLVRGIELGNPHHYPEAARRLIANHPYEFVIGSLHKLRDDPKEISDRNFSEFTFEQVCRYFDTCLDENIEIINWGHIDILAHVTYMKRYVKLTSDYDLKFPPFYDKFRYIFELLLQKDIALELNVSTLWQGRGFPLPELDVLKLWHDCGGRHVTIGSDAHAPRNLSRRIPDGLELLKEAGFTHLCVWRNGAREEVPIPTIERNERNSALWT